MLIDSKTFNHYTLQCLSRAYNRQLSLSYQKYIDAAATTLSVTQNLNELFNNTKKNNRIKLRTHHLFRYQKIFCVYFIKGALSYSPPFIYLMSDLLGHIL